MVCNVGSGSSSCYGKVWWWSGFVVLGLLRVYLLSKLSLSLGVFVLIWSVWEGLELILGVWNAFVTGNRDYRIVGFAVPACYLLGWLLFPHLSVSPMGAGFAIVSAGLSMWALWHLRYRFTFGSSAFVSLCDSGPYRWVRHPQSLARLLLIIGALFSIRGFDDLWRAVVCLGLCLVVIGVEEGALSCQPEWVQYAKRVKYRLLPGVL